MKYYKIGTARLINTTRVRANSPEEAQSIVYERLSREEKDDPSITIYEVEE